MKTILSVQEQIRHMKEKGITFQHVTEVEAADFLANNTYYMKLAAYRANYMKYETGARAGQYRDLDFGYLKELSTLDMHLRYWCCKCVWILSTRSRSSSSGRSPRTRMRMGMRR